MPESKAAIALGTAVALIVGYGGIIAAVTHFQPTDPDPSDGASFLGTYYTMVVDKNLVDAAWEQKLDEDFKRNLAELRGEDQTDYRKFWAGYIKVDLSGTRQVSGTDEFSSNLIYTFRRTSRRSSAEKTYFTLVCPWWTAFTIFGCNEKNIKIHNSYRD